MQKIELYDHNKTAYKKTETMLAKCGRAAVIRPTGTGKSYIAFALVENHPKMNFLWLALSEYTAPGGYKLGKWLCHQRAKYNSGKLAEEQIRILEETGMIWESTETVRAIRYWNVMYETVKQYADKHGGLQEILSDYKKDDGKKLGSWVAQQRCIRKGTIRHSIELNEEKIGMLDAIGMNWGRSAGDQAYDR